MNVMPDVETFGFSFVFQKSKVSHGLKCHPNINIDIKIITKQEQISTLKFPARFQVCLQRSSYYDMAGFVIIKRLYQQVLT